MGMYHIEPVAESGFKSYAPSLTPKNKDYQHALFYSEKSTLALVGGCEFTQSMYVANVLTNR